MSNTSQLQDLLRGALLAYSSDMPVSAESLSATVIETLDPDEAAPVLVRWGCVLELRQLARPLLRREFEAEKSDDQQDMFGGLQDRYPGTGDHQGLYMPRQMMTEADYLSNIDRLEREAQAKQQHADALRAEYMEKVAMGVIQVAA